MNEREEARRLAQAIWSVKFPMGRIDQNDEMIAIALAETKRIRAEAKAEAFREERARGAALHCAFCPDAPDDGSKCNCHQKSHFLNPAAILADHVPNAGKMMARAEDVETVRAGVQAIIGICDGTRGPEDHKRDPYETIADYAKNTLAALDRIVGKEE